MVEIWPIFCLPVQPLTMTFFRKITIQRNLPFFCTCNSSFYLPPPCNNFDDQLYLINSEGAEINQFQEGLILLLKQTVKPQVLEKCLKMSCNGRHMSCSRGPWEPSFPLCSVPVFSPRSNMCAMHCSSSCVCSVYLCRRFVDDILNHCHVLIGALLIKLSSQGSAHDRASVSAADAQLHTCGWDSLQTLWPEVWSFHQSG